MPVDSVLLMVGWCALTERVVFGLRSEGSSGAAAWPLPRRRPLVVARGSALLEVLLEGRGVVGVGLEPFPGGFGLLACAVLVGDQVFEAVVLVVGQLEVLEHLGDLGEVIGEPVASDDVQVL